MDAPLTPGLYLVATPIGTARDITLRALDVMARAEVLAAEDTRSARRLFDIHGIGLNGRRIIAYHDRNGPVARPVVLRALSEGKSVAYMSEAGTPLIADPGFRLVTEARAGGHAVTAVPGPSAVVTALMLAGLPTDRFLFAGFVPASETGRRKFFEEFSALPATLVFFESPKRIIRTVATMMDICGGERRAALCRELTKKFEEVRTMPLAELHRSVHDDPPKGEIVVLLDRSGAPAGTEGLDHALAEALQTMRTREAADTVSARLGLPRRLVYQAALRLSGKGPD